MSFARIPGQRHAKSLAAAWLQSRRLPHAVLVSGPPGTGKRLLALELAKAINCQAGSAEACDQCASCRKTAALAHPDVHVLLPWRRPRKEEVPGLEEIREAALEYLQQGFSLSRSNAHIAREHVRALQREMGYAPVEAPWRIGLIFEAECMHPAGANALLKILEEPPRHARFILVSASPERLLPTVRSRCQGLALRRLSQEELQGQLQQEGFDPRRAAVAAHLGGGSLQRARQVAAGEWDEARVQVERFFQAGIDGQDEVYWELAEELAGDRLRLERFLELGGIYLRDLFLLEYGRPAAQGDRREFLQALRAGLGMEQVEELAAGLDRGFACLGRNVHPQLVLAEIWRQVRPRSRARER